MLNVKNFNGLKMLERFKIVYSGDEAVLFVGNEDDLQRDVIQTLI